MTNTRTLAIVAILNRGNISNGTTFGATTPSVFAFKKGHEGSKDGDTITAQINAQRGYVSGFNND